MGWSKQITLFNWNLEWLHVFPWRKNINSYYRLKTDHSFHIGAFEVITEGTNSIQITISWPLLMGVVYELKNKLFCFCNIFEKEYFSALHPTPFRCQKDCFPIDDSKTMNNIIFNSSNHINSYLKPSEILFSKTALSEPFL